MTFSPFLTSPAAICAGPVAKSVVATPNPVSAHAAFTLTATLSDTTTGGFTIASAQFNINGGQYYPLYAKDGRFNQVTENVTGRVAISGTGRFTVCARGKDALGNTGATSCVLVIVLSATSTPSATVTPEATAAGGATATPSATTTVAEPTDTAVASATSTPASSPFLGIDTGSFPLIPVLIGVLALLVIIVVFLFLFVGRRRNQA